MQAAIEQFIEESSLTEEEAKQFAESVKDAVRETPSTPLAISRIRRFLQNAGPVIAGNFQRIAVDLFTEAMKKQIWP